MPNEFVIKNGYFSQGNSNITGSLTVTGGVTASLQGTASYALTASYAMNGGGTTIDTGSFTTTSSFNSFTSSYTTGSFTGSFIGDGSGLTGVISSSYALSSSFATTASYAVNGGVTQLFAGPNITLAPTTGVGQVTISSAGAGTYYNTSTGSYGSFYDTTTQLNPVANIPRSMSLNTTDITNGVSVSGSSSPFNTYLKIENAGVYNIQFSAQLIKTDSGTDFVDIWLRRNGVDLMDSATNVTLIGNNDRQVAAWNWFATAGAGDYYQIMWASADTNVQLLAEPATGVHPGIPSVIATVNRIDTFLSNTGSFTGSFTGTLTGTASFAINAATASYIEYTNVANKPTLISSSAQIATDISGAFASTSASLDAKINNVVATTVTTSSFNAFTASYATGSFTGSFNGSGTGLTGVISSSYAVSSSYALNALTSSYAINSQLLDGSDRAVFATTGSNIFKASQTITGSLTITNDLVVLGSSSIQYITSSQLDITTNIISVNTYNPAVRFGGIAVIDSGSSPQTSGSLLFDSQNNQWIFVHQDGGSAVTSSVLIMGPQTFNNIGNEATITTNRLTKGTGGDLGEHIGDSNITDTGTKVSINSNTEITGSLSQGIETTASGSYSHAEGYNTQAKGQSSHAEGYGSIALGGYSHAEGDQTTALGEYSHAEGQGTVAFAEYSHAEGIGSIASGAYSHAEGTSYAYGTGAHSEGWATIASGSWSHAEGYYTIASGSYQHASGKYNRQGDSTSLFIIGNGTSDVARSDIFRVTNTNVQVSGSLLVSGSLTVGGTIIGNGGMSMSGSNSVTGSLVITGSTSTDLVRITQTGTGNAFVVEDATNPDNSSFVIGTNGNIGIGTNAASAAKVTILTAFDGTATGISSFGQTTGVLANGGTIGLEAGSDATAVYGKADNLTVATGIGVWGQATFTGEGTPPILNIGGKFQADAATSNYSVQLIDGTETVAGRFLINQTTDGKANWGKTIPDIKITNAISGSNHVGVPTDAILQATLLYLSNNC